jgi:hypothetical protein
MLSDQCDSYFWNLYFLLWKLSFCDLFNFVWKYSKYIAHYMKTVIWHENIFLPLICQRTRLHNRMLNRVCDYCLLICPIYTHGGWLSRGCPGDQESDPGDQGGPTERTGEAALQIPEIYVGWEGWGPAPFHTYRLLTLFWLCKAAYYMRGGVPPPSTLTGS